MITMKRSYQGPFKWLCGWCWAVCSYINPCTLLCALCCKCCSCLKCCVCDCCPGWCPRRADYVAPGEVTAADYFEDDRTIDEGQIKEESRMKAVGSSLVAFLGGVLLVSLYAYVVLFWKSYNLWFCIVSAVSVGFFLCLGMAFSVRIRITVLLMLPHLFSGHTRAILLIIILSMAMQGPAANTVENFQVATGSISCGVEVAMNQTREIFSKIKEPLMNALTFLQRLAGKVKSVAGKAKQYFQKFKEYMKLVSRTLHHVWAFISSIGDTCNHEMLNPYRKCLKVFEDGKQNCVKMEVGPLCNLVDGFTWLCGVTKVVTVVCVIPSYVGDYMNKNVKAPIMALVQDIKHKFDYNLTINHDLGGVVNASKGVFTIVNDIMEEVREDLRPYREMLHIFSYSVLLISICTYILALRYVQKYTTDENFDNIYITRQFVDLDVNRAKQGLTALLPLSPRESYGLIRPKAFTLTRSEKKGYVFEIMNIFRSLLLVSLIMLGDYIVFWVMEVISSVLNGDITVRAPYVLHVNVTGSGFLNEILSQLADALDAVGQKNVTIIAKQCIPRPSEPDYYGYLTIGLLYIFTFFASFFGVYIHRLKRSICAYYYPEREQERICFLFNNLITRRMNLKSSLMRSIRLNVQDEGHRNIPMILASQIPGFSCVTRFFGASERYCMACAKMSSPGTSQDFTSCTTNGCRGLYCPACCEILNNICVVCMGPLAYMEDIEEELDSSDDGQLHLWIEALKTLKQKRAEKKKMKVVLKKRLRGIIKTRGLEADVVQRYKGARELSDSDEESSGFSEGDSGTDSGVTDYEYQDRSESDSDRED